MFKELLMRKLLQSKLGALPKEEQDKIIKVVTKNPELFQEIAVKIKTKMDSGMDQMKATMSVMEEYKDRVQKLMAEE
jgi:hypothetical protein